MLFITYFLKKENIVSLAKFAITGTIGLAIDFFITWLLRDALFINSYFASGCGFVVAASSNYCINSKWTFKKTRDSAIRKFVLFFAISLLGLAFSLFLIRVFQSFGISFYISKALAIGFVFIWNFSANKALTFRSSMVILSNNAETKSPINPLVINANAPNANI